MLGLFFCIGHLLLLEKSVCCFVVKDFPDFSVVADSASLPIKTLLSKILQLYRKNFQ